MIALGVVVRHELPDCVLRTATHRSECRLVGSSQLPAPARQHRGIYPLLAQQRAALAGLLGSIVLAQYPAFVGSRNHPSTLDGNDLRQRPPAAATKRFLNSALWQDYAPIFPTALLAEVSPRP
jgi:hypothetical protein